MIKALLTAVVALAAAALLALPAAAHTAMLRASPDRNATVGGSLAVIDLEFLDPITEASVTVAYNGTPLAGRTTVTDGQVITFALDQPLTQPGRYQVSYEMISLDGDFTADGYFFTFDPAAPPPARIDPSGSGPASGSPSESDGLPITTLALGTAAFLALVGLVALFARTADDKGADRHLEMSGSPWQG